MNKYMVTFKGREYLIEADSHKDALNKAMELDPELKEAAMKVRKDRHFHSGIETYFIDPKTGDWIE